MEQRTNKTMRAKEFIVEDPAKNLPKAASRSLPHGMRIDGTDQYYGYYRLGVAMAAAPEDGAPIHGPARDVVSIWPYTDADEEIAKRGIKNQGAKVHTLASKGQSQELETVNTVSPVAQWMKK